MQVPDLIGFPRFGQSFVLQPIRGVRQDSAQRFSGNRQAVTIQAFIQHVLHDRWCPPCCVGLPERISPMVSSRQCKEHDHRQTVVINC